MISQVKILKENRKIIREKFNRILLIVFGLFFIIWTTRGCFLTKSVFAEVYNWSFANNDDYIFDDTKLEISSGYAQLKAASTPDWYNIKWGYRREITINNNSTSTLSDYQIKVELTPDNFSYSHASSTLADLRFTDSSGVNLLSYWVENASNSTSTIWVKVPTISANSTSTIYMYYGNPFAISESNTSTTFIREIDGLVASWHFDEGGASETNYFTSDGAFECTLHDLHQQAAQYYNNHTYVGYIGPFAGTYIRSYNHNTQQWSSPVKIADYTLGGKDDHGAPSLLIDSSGYIHVFYGSHNNALRYKKSTNPEDISSWTTMSNVTNRATYPQAFQMSDGKIYVFYRGEQNYSYTNTADWSYRVSVDGGNTWSNEVAIINGDNVAKDGWYASFIKGPNDTIHTSFVYNDVDEGTDYTLHNVYYMFMDTDGQWKNASGTPLTIPLTKSDADQYAKVYDSGTDYTNFARPGVDAQNRPYILFLTGGAYGSTNFLYKFAKWNGTNWEIKNIGASATNLYDSSALNIIDSTEMEAYLTTGTPMDLPATGTFDDIGGTVEKWVSHNGGETWSRETIIINKSDINGEQIVRNYHSDAKLVFSQYGTMDWHNNKIYLYGDSGFVTNTLPIAKDSSSMRYDGNFCNLGTCHEQGPTWVENNCKFGKCLDFDGSNDHIYIDNEILRHNLASGSPYSIVGWFYPKGENNDPGNNPEQVLIDLGGMGGWNTYVAWRESDDPNWPRSTVFRPYNSTEGYGLITSSYNSNPEENWYHFVAMQGNGIARLYINGQEVTTSENPSPISHSGPQQITGNNKIQSQIGKDRLTEPQSTNWNQTWFKGLIDEFHIFEDILTSSEITDLYNNYGYSTPNYPNKLLVRRYISPEPSVNIGPETSLYSSDNPTIEPTVNNSLTYFDSLSSFIETAVKNGGEIKYILSNNGGTDWKYYNGLDWVTSDSTYSQANTAEEINEHITVFPIDQEVNKSFLFKAFLHSNGTQLIQLDNIAINYSLPYAGAGYEASRPAKLILSLSQNSLKADGRSISHLSAEVFDQYGAHLKFGKVNWSIVSGSGSINPIQSNIVNGFASSVYTAGIVVGDVIIKACTENNRCDQKTITLISTPKITISPIFGGGSRALTIGEIRLVKIKDSPAVYLIKNNQKLLIPHSSVFKSWGYDFKKVEIIQPSQLQVYQEIGSLSFRNGTLIRSNHPQRSTVYVVENAKLRPIQSAKVFQDLKYSWKQINWIDDVLIESYEKGEMISQAVSHPTGTLIKYPDSSSVYLIEDNKARPIKSAKVFESLGFKWKDILILPKSFRYEIGEMIE